MFPHPPVGSTKTSTDPTADWEPVTATVLPFVAKEKPTSSNCAEPPSVNSASCPYCARAQTEKIPSSAITKILLRIIASRRLHVFACPARVSQADEASCLHVHYRAG